MNNPFKILFVCTGNICRSPTADAVLRHKVRKAGLEGEILIDSAGTHGYHIGESPDPRSVSIAWERGSVDMSDLRARKVCPADFHEFDWIIAMDGGHHDILNQQTLKEGGAEILRFAAFIGQAEGDVLDPYYGGLDGFAKVYDLIDQGCEEIFKALNVKTLDKNKFNA